MGNLNQHCLTYVGGFYSSANGSCRAKVSKHSHVSFMYIRTVLDPSVDVNGIPESMESEILNPDGTWRGVKMVWHKGEWHGGCFFKGEWHETDWFEDKRKVLELAQDSRGR